MMNTPNKPDSVENEDLASISALASLELRPDGSLRSHLGFRTTRDGVGPRGSHWHDASTVVPDADDPTGAESTLGEEPLKSVRVDDAPGTMPAIEPGDALESRKSQSGSRIPLPEFAGYDGITPTRIPPSGFRREELIGRGGQGEVWSGYQGSLDRPIALKIQHQGSTSEFLAEACTAAALEHPNIVPVYDLTTLDVDGESRPALAMKRIQGIAWSDRLFNDREGGGAGATDSSAFSLPAHLAVHLPILVSVCNAVAFAHSRGILHRDLKPHQVLLGEFGEVYLLDWGLAVSMERRVPLLPPDGAPKHHTLESAVWCAGTPAYMAPEQASPDGMRLSVATDVYLLGAILFEIVSGLPPHPGRDARTAFEAARRNEIINVPDDVPAELESLIERSLATAAEDRPTSAAAFRDELQDFIAGESRRRESIQIARQAKERLDALPESPAYDALGGINLDLERALTTWGGNTEAARLREQLAGIHARVALRAGDLDHARYVAGGTKESERSALLQEVERASRARRRAALQRRVSFVAIVLLLVTIAGGALVTTWMVDQARDLALEQAEIALTEGARVRRVNEFILWDLSNHLDLRNPRDREVIGKVINVVINEIETTSTIGWTPEMLTSYTLHLTSVAKMLWELDRFDEAQQLLAHALEVSINRLSDHPRVRAEVHVWRAGFYRELGQFDAANRDSALALEIARREAPESGGPDGIDKFLNERIKVLEAMGKYKEAYELILELVSLEPGAVTGTAQWVTKAHNEIERQDLEAAEQSLVRAREFLDETRDFDVNERAVLNATAGLLEHQGRYGEAVEIREELLERVMKLRGPNHSEVIQARNNLASALSGMERNEEAEVQIREALRLTRELGMYDHADVIAIRGNLAALLRDHRGDLQGAEEILSELAESVVEVYGAEHPMVLTISNEHAIVLYRMGRRAEAIEAFERARDIALAVFGPDHSESLTIQHNLGKAARFERQLEKSERELRAVLTRRRAILPPDHPHTSITAKELAITLILRAEERHGGSPREEGSGANEIIAEAIDLLRDATNAAGPGYDRIVALAWALALKGEHRAAIEMVAPLASGTPEQIFPHDADLRRFLVSVRELSAVSPAAQSSSDGS